MVLRIKELREKAGLTQQEVANALDLHLTNYNKLENGKVDPQLGRLEQIAAILRCSVAELLGPYPSVRMVPVTFTVEAGAWNEGVAIDDSGAFDEVAVPDRPEWRGRRLYAAEVRGESMNRRYPSGSRIVIVDQVDTGGIGTLISSRAYVVERVRGSEVERTCKIYMQKPDGSRWLVPDSTDPTFEAFPLMRPGDDTEIHVLGRVVWSEHYEGG